MDSSTSPTQQKKRILGRKLHSIRRRMRCKICGIVKTKRRLRRHMIDVHHIRDIESKEKRTLTKQSNRKEARRVEDKDRGLFDRTRQFRKNLDKGYRCDSCGTETDSVANLLRHIRQGTCSGKMFFCPHCEYRTMNLKTLLYHQRKTHYEDVKDIVESKIEDNKRTTTTTTTMMIEDKIRIDNESSKNTTSS